MPMLTGMLADAHPSMMPVGYVTSESLCVRVCVLTLPRGTSLNSAYFKLTRHGGVTVRLAAADSDSRRTILKPVTVARDMGWAIIGPGRL